METYKIIICCIFANILVVSARGGGHGGSHGGSHGGGHSGGHSAGHSSHGSHAGAHGTHGYYHVTAHHSHYSYHPPSYINYMCRYCGTRQSYPVYHGLPPTYVFAIKESGGRYSDLQSGLALYNLGRSSERATYSHAHNSYTSQPEEKCSLQIIDQSLFEETRIPCFTMSTFMKNATNPASESQTFDITTSRIDIKSFLNNTGSPLTVTNTQECVLWHNNSIIMEKNSVPCALLKEYAGTVKSAGWPVYVWLPLLLVSVVAIIICCRCSNKKEKEDSKESAPLNPATVVGPYAYSTTNNN